LGDFNLVQLIPSTRGLEGIEGDFDLVI